ncbi:SDR family NAD(P)-dependent oxidoreductase [Oceanobacillus jeddahense]|uniref:SDR family NAD(P)-dependent oxidoreductase n=1 Tax=Oceanobacillus jeddahense TaxID=1462527 RepID=UPI00363C1394
MSSIRCSDKQCRGVFGQHQVSHDGFEITFAVNYLAPFLLTHLLLDKLKASGAGRIINLASVMEDKKFAPDNAVDQTASNYSGMQAFELLHLDFKQNLKMEIPANTNATISYFSRLYP